VKDSPVDGTSTSVEAAMSDRRDERDAFLGASKPDQRSINCWKTELREQFFAVVTALSESGLLTMALKAGGCRSRALRRHAHLGEFARVGRRPASRRKRRRLERLTKMRENLTDGRWIAERLPPLRERLAAATSPDSAISVVALRLRMPAPVRIYAVGDDGRHRG